MKDSYVFYRGFANALARLPKDIQLELFWAITNYGLDRQPQQLSNAAAAYWDLIQPQINANWLKYQNGCKGGEHGKKGGRPKKQNPKITPEKPHNNPSITRNENVNDNVNENVNEKENENDLNAGDKIASKTNTLMARPTLQEVVDYFRDKGYKEETARQAFNHYEAADWKVGDMPIYNWKQKMARWFTDNNRAVYEPPKTERPIMPPAYNPADWKP